MLTNFFVFLSLTSDSVKNSKKSDLLNSYVNLGKSKVTSKFEPLYLAFLFYLFNQYELLNASYKFHK